LENGVSRFYLSGVLRRSRCGADWNVISEPERIREVAMRRLLWCVVFTGFINIGTVSAQAWPDYHLTNGTHYTSYGVKFYDPDNPIKNLYIDPVATLRAGSDQLDEIYDSNQVYLDGGTIYASAIDANDLTWSSGSLHLDGGNHSILYGLDNGTGKDLFLRNESIVNQTSLNALFGASRLVIFGGKLSVANDFDASINGLYFTTGTLEVGGTLTGLASLDDVRLYESDYNLAQRTLLLNGSLARWDLGSTAFQGSDNQTVILANGGTMESTGGSIGDRYKNNSSVEISGPGSKWSNSGSLTIGATEGFNNSLVITSGGIVSNSSASIGSYWGGDNEVRVSGAGSQWINAGTLIVGLERGSGNRLVIENGGIVSSSDGYIGTGNRGTHGNTAEVSGLGSRWSISGGLTIGVGGFDNRLVISDGGVVSNSVSRIGISSGGSIASGTSVTVMGLGSLWHNSESLTIGAEAPDCSMVISEGGVVNNTDSYIGRTQSYPGDGTRLVDGNSVVVSGTGSKWNNSGTLTIGHALNTRNTLTITNGGEVVVGGRVIINGTGNTLNLDREGRLMVETDFDASMEGFNYNSGSTLAVEGQLSGLSLLAVGRRLETPSVLGDMTVHGTFAPGNSPADSVLDGILTIASDGTLEMELGGYVLGEEYDRLTVTGTAYLDGTLDVVLLDGFTVAYGDSFDLFNWSGGVSGEFASISTLALTGSLEWDTSKLYTNGTLSVIPEPGTLGLMGISTILFCTARNLSRRKRRRMSLFPVRIRYTDDFSFEQSSTHVSTPECSLWRDAMKATVLASVSDGKRHITGLKKSFSNRFFDRLIALDGIMDTLKKRGMDCFDVFLARVMR